MDLDCKSIFFIAAVWRTTAKSLLIESIGKQKRPARRRPQFADEIYSGEANRYAVLLRWKLAFRWRSQTSRGKNLVRWWVFTLITVPAAANVVRVNGPVRNAGGFS